MRLRTWSWLVLLLFASMACQGPQGARRSSGYTSFGTSAFTGDSKGGAVVSEEAANGLAAGESAAKPLAGAFYNDGSEGDVRGRTENYFASSDPSRPAAAASTAKSERMLTYQGEVRLEVARPEDARAQLLAKVKEWGGYLQSQSGNSVTVRIPTKQFDATLEVLHGLGRVLAETVKADDVTEEFTDLAIRIDNARKSRDRLLEVLKKAEKVDEILRVEAELRRLTEEIERMEGHSKFLADQVAMALLRVTLQAVAEAPPVRHSRQPSRFAWINAIGAERMMGDF